MKAALEQRVEVPCGDVTLESVLHRPASHRLSGGVVVCHPHPQYGGDMDNNVVVAAARGLLEQGLAVLRFNFRGVGGSSGRHSGGSGERDDVRAAIAFLGAQQGIDGQRLGLAGYSFGAAVALSVAPEALDVQAVAGIGCPLAALCEPALARYKRPKLFITGALDGYVPLRQFQEAVSLMPEPKDVRVLAEADHFFQGQERDISGMVGDFFARYLKGGP